MQCSVALERDRGSGNKMKTNSYKNPYRKESNLDNIVDQLCTRLQDIKDQSSASRAGGMPTCALEQSEAVRRYYAAFPALSGRPEPYHRPPPAAWCRPPAPPPPPAPPRAMLAALERDAGRKKLAKERRASYHAPKKTKKRSSHSSRSLDHHLPEWVTSEGVWDMDANDPVKEFIRALALDEGYGTAEATLCDEPRAAPPPPPRPAPPPRPSPPPRPAPHDDWLLRDDLQPRALTPADEELYAKFEAKFDRSLEALWANTPDDDYQELPIDFHELLSSPSDRAAGAPAGGAAECLRARLAPLRLADAPPPAPELESFALYSGDELFDALSSVADTLRSLTAINHSRDRSGFVEVPPRPRAAPRAPAAAPAAPAPPPAPEREDLLTSARTHFRPIRREADSAAARYSDGDSFDIRGDLEPVDFRRSARGGVYVGSALYLEYRTRSIDYGRLELTPAQRTTLDEPPPRFRLRFPLRQRDAAVQTDAPAWPACGDCGRRAKKMRATDSIWSAEPAGCAACRASPPAAAAPSLAPDELSRDWEELLSDISAAHAEYARGELLDEALVSAERKRRHSAALRSPPPARSPHCPRSPRPPRPACAHPHARFLHCCAALLDRPLTR